MKKTALKVWMRAALLCAVSAVAELRAADPAAAALWMDDATVATNYGSVQGSEDIHATWVWKAIPYGRR